MARLSSLGLLCAALAFAEGCKRAATEPPPPEVVATVDGQPIYSYQIERELKRYKIGEDAGQQRLSLAGSILDQLVLERVLLAEADRKGVEISKEETAEAMEQLADGYRSRDFYEMIHHNFLTPSLLQDRMVDRMRIERVLELEVSKLPAPSDAELRAYYQDNSDKFQVPQQVRVRQIVVRTREEAEKHRESARRGALFEELARKHSVAPEASRGGDLGYFGRGVMPPIFDQVCFALEPGAISEVVTSEYGFHLFQVVEARSAGAVSFEEAHAAIVRELTAVRRQQAAAAFVDQLRERAQVKRNVDAVARLVGREGA